MRTRTPPRPHVARRRPHAREVARAIAQQRRGLAAQMGPHELAEGVVLDRQRGVAAGLDELQHGPPVGGQVQPLARLALAGHGRPHVAHAEAVGHRGAPGRLDLLAHRAQPGARLAGRDDVAQPQVGRLDPGLARAPGEVGREGERAVDRGEPEARDEVEQALRLAHAHGHDGRAGGLERHVVGDPARVERVVQAVGDDVARCARRRWRRPRRRWRELASWSARVRPMATGSPVVPEVTCRRTSASGGAHRCSPKGGRAACEARRSALVEQRDVLERPRAGAGARDRRARCAPDRRAALAAPRRRPRAHASRPATRRAARWAARCRDASGGECRVRWRRVRSLRGSCVLCDASYAGFFPPSSAARPIFTSAPRMRRLTEPMAAEPAIRP